MSIVLQVPFSSRASTAISIGIYVGLMSADSRVLRRAGLTRLPSRWWVILAPGYLWQRASILKRGRAAFGVMLAAIAATGVLQVLVAPRYANTFMIVGSDGKHYLTEYYNTTSDQGPSIRIVVHTASEPM